MHMTNEPRDIDNMVLKALDGQLEEREVVKLAISLRKINSDRTIEFVDKVFDSYPPLKANAALREQRARAHMDLAKKSIEAGRDKENSPRDRALAWEQCRELLTAAEIDLNTALKNSKSRIEKDYIRKDMEFLVKMKRASQKPSDDEHRQPGKPRNFPSRNSQR